MAPTSVSSRRGASPCDCLSAAYLAHQRLPGVATVDLEVIGRVPDQEAFRLPWRPLALASLLLNMVAVVTIAVVASITSAGALETVALALSIIAFVCQLIIYSVQTWQSGEQLRQARELNAQTIATLTDVRTRIEGTHQMVSTQYAELMHLTSLKASSALRKEAAEFEDDRVSVASIVTAMEHAAVLPEDTSTRVVSAGNGRSLQRRYWTFPIPWPASEAEAAGAIAALDSPVVDMHGFALALEDDISSEVNDVYRGLPFGANLDGGALEAGLLDEFVRDGRRFVRLSRHGRTAGQCLLAPFPIPGHLSKLNDTIRRLRGKIPQRDRLSLEEVIGDISEGALAKRQRNPAQ
jgi:hypothetical protein